MSMTVASLDEQFRKDARNQGLCDGRWNGRRDTSDFDEECSAIYNRAYDKGALDRKREPGRW